MPVLKHFTGNCHVYVDRAADLVMAKAITVNAKCQRMGVCNAAESLLVHRDVADRFLPDIAAALGEHAVEIVGDAATRRLVPAAGTATETTRIGVLTAVIGLSLLVLWDQVPRAPAPEQLALIARQVEADRGFVAEMESVLPDGAMIFQLPVMEFPETPVPGIASYDHFRPYLHGRLRYSFGSMKGRPREQWQPAVQQKMFEGAVPDQQAQKIRFSIANVNAAIDEMQKRGFKAVYINRNGFPDRGKGLLEALAELGFDTVIASPLGDLTCVLLGKPAGK
jgi:hypothetical protein